MSKSRAKSKQRQRATAREGRTVAPEASAPRAAKARASRVGVRVVERPDPPWAPFPLTEIGMAVGIVLFGLSFAAGGDRGPWLLTIGVLLLGVVVGDLCLREHFAGFRSHSILLGLLPVTAAHMLVVHTITRDWRGPSALVVDLSAAAALAWWLQRRFEMAAERAAAAAP